MNNINKLAKKSSSASEFAQRYFDYLHKVLNTINPKSIELLVKEFEDSAKKGSTIFVAGNGGSSATSSTLANDLGFDILKKTRTKNPFRIFSLNDNAPVMTAISNDVGYENLFINQLKIHYRKGDKVIFISVSGNSKNLINAAKWVKLKKGKIISFLGFDGGQLRSLSDIVILSSTQKGEYGPAEDSHLIINHILAHWFQNFPIK
jgi:D-sedoheptulose 7-phosphate isomerase